MTRFISGFCAILFPMVAAILMVERPWGVSDAEMMRRYLMVGGLALAASILGGLLVWGIGRVSDWVDRKTDPWRRLN